MLKIVAVVDLEDKAVLYLEGQVIGPWVAELERVCEPIVARGSELDLDLSTVSFLSREGVELLSRLRHGRARLLNCSPFVTEQLRRAGAAGANGSGPMEDRGNQR